MEDFNSQDSQEIMKNFKSIVGSRLDKLYDEKGSDGELYAYSIAVTNQKKKKAKETTPNTTMENNRLREMVKAALSNPKAADLNNDGELSSYEKKRGAAIEKSIQKEDLDLGHQDNEPHMLKADLYRIGKYAMELYKMVDKFEGPQEVDFPGWWQSKITTAKNMISSAKHYLEFELKEPEIDAMVGVASEEGAVGEEMTPEKSRKKGMPFKDVTEEAIDEMSKKQIKKRGKIFDALVDKGMSKKKAGPIATSTAMKEAKAKIKEAILAKLKNK
jgi:hypothetical protein